MNFDPISEIAISGMYITLFLCFMAPPLVWVIYRIRTRRKKLLIPFFAGISSFLLSSVFVRTILLMLLSLGIPWLDTPEALWVSGTISILFTVVLEQFSRYFFFTILDKSQKCDRYGDALSFGLGHVLIEAILLLGITTFINLTYATAVNNGEIHEILAGITDPESRQSLIDAIIKLSQSNPFQFFFAGVERISALIMQCSLSVLVWMVVHHGIRKHFFRVALVAHFIFNMMTFILAQTGSPPLNVEVVSLSIAILTALFTRFVYRKGGFVETTAEKLSRPLYSESKRNRRKKED